MRGVRCSLCVKMESGSGIGHSKQVHRIQLMRLHAQKEEIEIISQDMQKEPIRLVLEKMIQ